MTDSIQNINPLFKKGDDPHYTIEELISGIQKRESSILAHLISKAESHLDNDQELVHQILQQLPSNTKSKIIAVTGSPGVGKSTFIDSIGGYLTQNNKSVAVLPVDPTSQISKGSILGDKTRMEKLTLEKKAFIKPMSSSLSLGGVAPASFLATEICKKASFDYIFIETVGVGQSEYEVRYLVDCFILLLQPGGGDDLQGIKRGIMEMTDILIVNKADDNMLTLAKSSLNSYVHALKLMLPNPFGWSTRSSLYSSVNDDSAESIPKMIDDYFMFLYNDNLLMKLRIENAKHQFEKYSKDLFLKAMLMNEDIKTLFQQMNNEIESGQKELSEAIYKIKLKINEGI